jgi:hypothetical protein
MDYNEQQEQAAWEKLRKSEPLSETDTLRVFGVMERMQLRVSSVDPQQKAALEIRLRSILQEKYFKPPQQE